ncbi:MAG: hypothetical protein JSU03_02530 [Bacteroidetes bacterium]|nr:hypothetical protein [Bacteroidota bacterium]MBS1756134.1 hypothetical protein [Bacteroidota bacterium]
MSKLTKILLLSGIFTGLVLAGFADRGIGKKSKYKISLNIKTTGSFSNNLSFNLKSGLTYKGSLLNNNLETQQSFIINNSFSTYQKGNTVYIVPFKQKILVPEVQQGYTGMKLIIRHN